MGTTSLEKTRNWERGQQSQLDFWERWSRQPANGDLAGDLARRAQSVRLLIETAFACDLAAARILEVGAACRPVVHFLPGRYRACVDPLISQCVALRQDVFRPGVDLFQAVAEQLPFPDRSFDVCIFLNAIDVCLDAERAMGELERVLDDGGRLVISANTYGWVSRSIRIAACATGLCRDSLSYPRVFSEKSFREAVETRFRVVRSLAEPSDTRWRSRCGRTTLLAEKGR